MFSFRLLAVSVLLASSSLQAQAPQTQFVGCVTNVAGAGFQLTSIPSGSSYLVQGNPALLQQHANQLVRVQGTLDARTGNQAPPSLIVQNLGIVSEICVSALGVREPVAVVGKVGEGQVAIPLTTSASAGETTPGFQTENIKQQEPPISGRMLPPAATGRAESAYSPSNTAQVAQSAVAANTFAEAATRSEIQPGSTLGTSATMANSVQNAKSASHPQP